MRMRELIETVTVSRDPSRKGGVEIEISGRLTHLLGPKAYPQGVRAVWGRVVAEERFGRRPQQPEIPYLLRSCV